MKAYVGKSDEKNCFLCSKIANFFITRQKVGVSSGSFRAMEASIFNFNYQFFAF